MESYKAGMIIYTRIRMEKDSSYKIKQGKFELSNYVQNLLELAQMYKLYNIIYSPNLGLFSIERSRITLPFYWCLGCHGLGDLLLERFHFASKMFASFILLTGCGLNTKQQYWLLTVYPTYLGIIYVSWQQGYILYLP